MDRIIEVRTIDEEFEKSRVKAHVRTRKGKMERVKEHWKTDPKYSRSYHVMKKEEGGPDITSADLKAINRSLERNRIPAQVSFKHSHLVGHKAVVIEAATKSAEMKAKKETKDLGLDWD